MANLLENKYWYHATTVKKTAEIFTDTFGNRSRKGTLEDKAFGLYFANTADYAGSFVRMNDMLNPTSHIVVFKIARDRIPNIELGTDHNPMFFPKDLITAVSYGAKIPVTLNDICAEWYYGEEAA